jgi:hypothetical protein
MSEPVKRLRDCAADPMWDAHAEVPKSVLTKAADRIEALEAALRYYADPNNYSGYGMYEIARTALASEQDK